MTDLTDQDRRAARAWAKNWQGDQDDDTSAAARVILATVDAPDPTLAEEILDAAARIRDAVNPGDRDVSWADMESCANRAEQMEQDAEDRQEWNRRITEQVATLARERDEALAEVERLTAERDGAREEIAWLRNGPGHTEVATDLPNPADAQKGAESNAETPDPADVPAGEAWLVECRGERRNAVKDRDDNNEPWNTIDANGRYVYKRNENVTLVSRLVPAPRVITDPDELERLAAASIIRDGRGWPGGVTSQGAIMINGSCYSDEELFRHGPVTVLWEA